MEKNTKNKELQEPVVPFEVVVEDTENAIIAIINQSNLPTCIVSNILSNFDGTKGTKGMKGKLRQR